MTAPEYIFQIPGDEDIGGITIPRGQYVASKQNAAELLVLSKNGKIRDFRDVPQVDLSRLFNPKGEWNGKTVLFCRSGGFGDLLAMTPTIHEIRERWPECQVEVATHPRHMPILDNNPDVSRVLPWPLSVSDWNRSDAHVWLDQSIERQENNRTMHFVDLVAQECGGIIPQDKRMRYTVTEDEERAALTIHPHDQKYSGRIGVQVHSNARNRTYPVQTLHQVLLQLHDKGWEIFLFGDKEAIKDTKTEGVHCISGQPFRAACAILSTCRVVLAPDSSLCHVAGALNLPTVALYGPFPWKLRTAYNPSVRAIQGHAKCAPCFHHVANGSQFPQGCPTAEKGFCQALASIEPKRIVKLIEEAATL